MLMRHASHPHEQQGRGPRGGGGNITAAAAISANLSHQGKQLLSSIDRSIDRSMARITSKYSVFSTYTYKTNNEIRILQYSKGCTNMAPPIPLGTEEGKGECVVPY